MAVVEDDSKCGVGIIRRGFQKCFEVVLPPSEMNFSFLETHRNSLLNKMDFCKLIEEMDRNNESNL